jgi:hypothetical protein
MAIAPLAWTIRLYEGQAGRRAAILAVALFGALFGWLLFENVLIALLGFAAILGSTAEYWLPLHYRIDKNRAAVRCGISVTAIEWSDVKRVVTSEQGWKLSPLAEETRLSPFRGVYLRLPPEPEPVQNYVRSHVGQDVRFVEHGTDFGGGVGPSGKSGSGDPEAETGDGGRPGPGDA